MLTVEQLLKELAKLPPQTNLQEVRVKGDYGSREIVEVKWQGTYVGLEMK
jgi:hypothetical protein